MEIFLLTLVREGVNTMYALQKQAHLSPGGIRPVLSRLENDRLIQRAGKGIRKKRVMKITAQGRHALQTTFTGTMADTASWDLESAVRVVWSAVQFSPSAGRHVAEHIAQQRSERATALQSQAADFKARVQSRTSSYDWMQAMSKSRQLRAESEAIGKIGEHIKAKDSNSQIEIPDSLRRTRGYEL